MGGNAVRKLGAMPSLPHIDARAATAVGTALMPPGPALDAPAAEALVAGLRAAAEASVTPVAEVTGLDVPQVGGPMRIVDRPTWLGANVDMALTMLDEAGGGLPETDGVLDHAAARANGAQLGGALAVLGTRILGQWLPFLAEPQLVVVAPNVAKIEAVIDVDPVDFRLWICLHEQTHRLQFSRAPWLRSHLIGEMGALVAEGLPGHREGRRPAASVVEAVLTPEQRVVFARVGAAMSLLEGYADDMMDRVGPAVVPSVAHIRRVFEARRNRGGWPRLLNKLLGMDLKLAQYREGARFCRAVIGRVGVDGLNVVYDAPAYLPTPEEMADPQRWVARVHG